MLRRAFVAISGAALLPAAAKRTALFNGKNLKGWTYYLWDPKTKTQDTATPMSSVWTVKDGILRCAGKPPGYLKTLAEYSDYRLSVEWMWPPDTTRGNNGVLVHTTTPNALGVWPKCIEVQLFTGDAGDFWVIGTTLDIPNAESRRKDRRHINLTDGSEKPFGQWNHMEILCKGSEITVWVNGDLVNHATNVSQTKGAICLQSEGAPISYRNIYIQPA